MDVERRFKVKIFGKPIQALVSAVATIFRLGGPTNVIRAGKCIRYVCFWLQAHCIVYFIYLFFFLKMTKIKAIK